MKVFISYRRKDSHYIADRIYDWLEREFGRDNLFKDIDAIPLGRDFGHGRERPCGRPPVQNRTCRITAYEFGVIRESHSEILIPAAGRETGRRSIPMYGKPRAAWRGNVRNATGGVEGECTERHGRRGRGSE
jgi:hypothetical protein